MEYPNHRIIEYSVPDHPRRTRLFRLLRSRRCGFECRRIGTDYSHESSTCRCTSPRNSAGTSIDRQAVWSELGDRCAWCFLYGSRAGRYGRASICGDNYRGKPGRDFSEAETCGDPLRSCSFPQRDRHKKRNSSVRLP